MAPRPTASAPVHATQGCSVGSMSRGEASAARTPLCCVRRSSEIGSPCWCAATPRVRRSRRVRRRSIAWCRASEPREAGASNSRKFREALRNGMNMWKLGRCTAQLCLQFYSFKKQLTRSNMASWHGHVHVHVHVVHPQRTLRHTLTDPLTAGLRCCGQHPQIHWAGAPFWREKPKSWRANARPTCAGACRRYARSRAWNGYLNGWAFRRTGHFRQDPAPGAWCETPIP